MKSLVSISLLCLTLLVFPVIASAQLGGFGGGGDLTISLSPKYPKPHESVTITVRSYSVDLDTSYLTWTAGGTVLAEGMGVKEASVIANGIGSMTEVSITVAPRQKSPFTESIIIAPSVIEFLVEAETYTPPFYKGRALFTEESRVSIVAVPRIANEDGLLSAEKLVYRWLRDGKMLQSQSGYGARKLTVSGNRWGRDEEIAVTISSEDGRVSSEETLVLEPRMPVLAVYEENPLLGTLYNRSIRDIFSLPAGSETSFLVEPFYFSKNRMLGDNTEYAWKMNRKPITNQGNGNLITFRADSDVAGRSIIDINVKQKDALFQKASESFSIEFN